MITAGNVFGRNRWEYAVALILLLGVGSPPLMAKGKSELAIGPSEQASGLAAGRRDARHNGVAVLSGVRLGPAGLILPWVIGTEMPGGDLVGKSAEYVGVYVEEYRNRAKPKPFLYWLAGEPTEPPKPYGQETVDCCRDYVCSPDGLKCAGEGLSCGCEALGELGETVSGFGSAMNSCRMPGWGFH